VSVADCTFVRIGPRGTQYKNLQDFGLFNYNVDIGGGHRCLAYESSIVHDAATKTAQAFACMAAILSGFAMLQIVSLHLFLRWKKELVWNMARVEVLVATFSQAIVFAGFGTDVCVDDPDAKCVLGPAGIINTINVLFLAILSWLCWGMLPPAYPIFEVKLMVVQELDSDCENGVVFPENAVTTEEESFAETDAWGVTAQRPPTFGNGDSDAAIYGGSCYNSRGSSSQTKDFEVSNRVPGQDSQNSVIADLSMVMKPSPGADPLEMNGRRGQVASSEVYEDEYEPPAAQYDESSSHDRPRHHHHHHKKKHHRDHSHDSPDAVRR